MNLLTHLGLGDHLITYGLVRELANRYDHNEINVGIFCKEQNLESLLSMYKYTNVGIIVPTIKDETEAFERMRHHPYTSLKIGYTSQSETEINFGESFYKQAGIDFECRYKYQIGRNEKQITIDSNIFVHDTDNFIIKVEGFRPHIDITPDITQYCDAIENASEVHVIESSFKQLIEFLNPKGKLFLHKFENKSFRVVSSRHNWEIIQH